MKERSVNTTTARILQVSVGLPQTYVASDPRDQPPAEWRTAIDKSAVEGSVQLTTAGLEGDGCADRQNHGGIEGAVLLYAAGHYLQWRIELPEHEWQFGGFGENLTIDGLTEETVCIGDCWRIGTVLLEVSKPRQPCWKLCRRWQQPDLAKRVVQAGRGGWYARVLETGEVSAGDEMSLEDRPHPRWTVARTCRLYFGIERDSDAVRELAAVPQLSLNWREELLNRQV